MSSFEPAFESLKGLTNYETMVRPPYGTREMNLPRTRSLLRALGEPQRSFPSLQVAGTKGKGTAAHSLAAILRAAGYRVGLYTSPHLFHVRERIAVDGEWIPEEEFARGVAEILRHVDPLRGTPECPTFFELVTCLGLWYFARAGVNAAVLEVGLGGRLDATTAVKPLASLITHVGLDHTLVLGSTTTEIAYEKAGVAKRGVPLVSGVSTSSAAGQVIEQVAKEKGAPLFAAGREFAVRTGRPSWEGGRPSTPLTLRGADEVTRRLRASVLGRDLARDAGLAAATLLVPKVAKRLPVEVEHIEAGLASLSVPGRIQVVSENPLVVVDGAHNPDSAQSLVRTLREALTFRRIFAILGGGEDKNVPVTARHVAGLRPGVKLVFTRPSSHPRAADPERLAAAFPGAKTAPDPATALARAQKEAKPEDLILVTGSLYLAGEVLTLLDGEPERV